MAGNHYYPLFTGSFNAESRSCTLYVPLFEWITPKESPVTMPNYGLPAGTPGQNEFTYDTASPGVLTIGLEMLVKPTGTAQSVNYDGTKFSDRCFFSLPDPIVGSTFAWDNAHPGGKSSPSGEMVVALSTYTNLPALNSEFGLKVAEMTCDGMIPSEIDPLGAPGQEEFGEFEVFFMRDEKNHPGLGSGTTPNWFFYWLQTVQLLGTAPDVNYDPAGSYYDPNTNKIFLSDGDRLVYNAPYGTNNPLKGIDNFAWTAMHESQHYEDWENYWDVANQGVNKFAAAAGGVNPSDNKDGTLAGNSDYLPNSIEDVDLSKSYNIGDLYDWNNFRTGNPPIEILNDAEDYTCKRHTGVKGDHSKDWGNPGMNHKTVGKYDD